MANPTIPAMALLGFPSLSLKNLPKAKFVNAKQTINNTPRNIVDESIVFRKSLIENDLYEVYPYAALASPVNNIEIGIVNNSLFINRIGLWFL